MAGLRFAGLLIAKKTANNVLIGTTVARRRCRYFQLPMPTLKLSYRGAMSTDACSV